ncbi:MAG: hypothetical protein AABX11_06020 [Nanoarchaeota archaeon]
MIKMQEKIFKLIILLKDMLPRWHILLGAIFTLGLGYFVPQLGWMNLAIVFFASFLIDFDHYVQAVMKTGKIGLFKAFAYHREQKEIMKKEKAKGIKRKGDFHLFHTLEFHALIALLGIFYFPMFFVFIGITFHSLLDVIAFLDNGYMYRREYFFFNWLAKEIA